MSPPEGRARGTAWHDVAWLMLSDIVGTSVLTFPGVALHLGWVLTVVFIIGLFPISLFVSVLMTRTRQLLEEVAASRWPRCSPPRLDTMGEVARCAFGTSQAACIVYACVYGLNLLGQASYLLVLGTSLQQVFWSRPICLTLAVALVCAALLLPLCAVRRLGESVWMCFANSLIIVIAIVVALVNIYSQDRRACTETYWVPPGLTAMTVLGQATNVIYAYTGQWMYFELMETMAVPRDFPRAFAITAPFMVGTYLAVALLGYALGAGDRDLVAGMAHGTALSVAAALIFVHVAIVYLIKSLVLARFLHGLCCPRGLDARDLASYLQHGGWGAVMLCFGYVVANAVPFFSQLLGLIGGLLAGPINFVLPILLYLMALGRHTRLKEAGANSDSGLEGSSAEQEDSSYGNSQSGGEGCGCCEDGDAAADSEEDIAVGAVVCAALRALPAWEVAMVAITLALVLPTMVLGVADQVRSIVSSEAKFGAPFSCHSLPDPNATACGAAA